MEGRSSVYFSRSYIGTRYDCISIGQGNSQVIMTSISCGPVPMLPYRPSIITLHTSTITYTTRLSKKKKLHILHTHIYLICMHYDMLLHNKYIVGS